MVWSISQISQSGEGIFGKISQIWGVGIFNVGWECGDFQQSAISRVA